MRFGKGTVLACAVIALSVLCPSVANAAPAANETPISIVKDASVDSGISPISQNGNPTPPPIASKFAK